MEFCEAFTYRIYVSVKDARIRRGDAKRWQPGGSVRKMRGTPSP